MESLVAAVNITCRAPVFYVLLVFLSELLFICCVRSVDVVLSLPMVTLPEIKLTMMLLMMTVTCTRHFRILDCSNLTIKRQPATEAIRYIFVRISHMTMIMSFKCCVNISISRLFIFRIFYRFRFISFFKHSYP